jgi:putative redox protein
MAKINSTSAIDASNTLITNGRNDVIADQNISEGGLDEGLCPTELLAGALAACASMSIRFYAKRKNIQLEQVDIDVELVRDNALNTSKIIKTITFHGNLSDDDKQRMLKIADMCFVQKILSNPITFETELK